MIQRSDRKALRSPHDSSWAHNTYEVLEGVSHWIPEEVPQRLDARLAGHFEAASAHTERSH